MPGALFVVFKDSIRQIRTTPYAAVVIVNWGTLGTQKESSNIGFIGTLFRSAALCARIFHISMLPGDARPEAYLNN